MTKNRSIVCPSNVLRGQVTVAADVPRPVSSFHYKCLSGISGAVSTSLQGAPFNDHRVRLYST